MIVDSITARNANGFYNAFVVVDLFFGTKRVSDLDLEHTLGGIISEFWYLRVVAHQIEEGFLRYFSFLELSVAQKTACQTVIEGDIGVLSKCAEDCGCMVLIEDGSLQIVYTWLWKGWRYWTRACWQRDQDIRYDLLVEEIKILDTTLWVEGSIYLTRPSG